MVDPVSLTVGVGGALVGVLNSNAGAKLVETVSAGLGKFAGPYHRRREAKAEAEALVELAKGRAEAQEIEFRAAERLLAVATRRQENIEEVVALAAKELPETVSDTPVVPDWTARFFDGCQDVSDEEMRGLWAKILAGEVAEPGSYSLRTLHALQHLTKEEARLFESLCAGSMTLGYARCPMIFDLSPEATYAAGIAVYSDLQTLADAGLLHMTNLVSRVSPGYEQIGVCFDLGALGIMRVVPPPLIDPMGKFSIGPQVPEVSLGQVQLTPTGDELSRLAPWAPTQARIDAAKAGLERSRHVVTFESKPQ